MWTPPFWLRKLDLVREEHLEPSEELSPTERFRLAFEFMALTLSSLHRQAESKDVRSVRSSSSTSRPGGGCALVPSEPFEILPHRLKQTLLDFIDLLEGQHVPYMIFGAIAVAMWGTPRGPADVDFTVSSDAGGLEAIGEQAERQGFMLDRQWLEWNLLRRGIQIRLTKASVFIDVTRPRDRQDEAALSRRRALEVEGRRLWFVSSEDLILMKLKAGRPRDFEDAVSIVARQRGKLDEGYMEEWALRLSIHEELAYVLGGGTFG